MPRKKRDPITAALIASARRELRNQKYKMMDAISPSLRPMLRMQRSLKTLNKTIKQLSSQP